MARLRLGSNVVFVVDYYDGTIFAIPFNRGEPELFRVIAEDRTKFMETYGEFAIHTSDLEGYVFKMIKDLS